MDRNPPVAYPISINYCGRFRKYDLPIAGNCNYGNFEALPRDTSKKRGWTILDRIKFSVI